MKATAMHLILVALCLCAIPCALSASECEVKLYADKTHILPFEPVGLVLKIENTSAGEVKELGSRWSSFRVAKSEAGMPVHWKSFEPCGIHATLPPPSWLKLSPGQVFTDFLLLHIDLDGNPVFEEPGLYFVQAGTPFGESEIVKIEVEGKQTIASIVKFLRDKGLYVLFDCYSAKNMVTTLERAEALALSLGGFRKMPKGTPYETWLPVCELTLLGRMSDIGSGNHTLKEDDLFARYLKIAEGLSSPQREHLFLAIATTQMEQGNVEDAEKTYSMLATSAADGYFRQLALYQLGILKRGT